MNDPSNVVWLPLVGGLLALGCLWGALRSAVRRRLVDGLPTSKTTGVFIGLVEVKGSAESEAPLTSHLAAVRCVHYAWSVEEKWSRTVTHTSTDSKGNTQTSTSRESGWSTVAEGSDQVPFYLRDDCGLLLVRPEGAEIEAEVVFEESCERGDPLYYAKGPEISIANSDHERRFRESVIPLHAEIYVWGRARERTDVVAAEIAADRAAPLFLISTRGEKQISRGFAIKFWSFLMLGLLLCSAGVGFGLPALGGGEGSAWIPFVAGAAGYAGVTGVCWVWSVFNGLIDLRNRVASAWSGVDVQLKRRFDLIPRLESVVQALAGHERAAQEGVAALRAQREATPPGAAGPDFQALRGRLVLLAENYPKLKADASFLKLQQELIDTEQRIALARGYYNEIATHYNTKLEVVPERFIAALGRFPPRALLTAGDFERAPVKVSLAE